MTDLKNAALDRLRDGQLALGIGLRQARTVDIAKAMRTAGFDWLFIDMEHNSMDLDTAVQISVAAQDAGITPVVRVPGYESFHATRALDGGAQGVVVPHVDDAATAARMVSQCRYPPVGHRSVTGALPQRDFRPTPLAEATETTCRMLTSQMGITADPPWVQWGRPGPSAMVQAGPGSRAGTRPGRIRHRRSRS